MRFGHRFYLLSCTSILAGLIVASPARGDIQTIAPGTADQDATVVNTGPNGICETAAASGDIQAAPVGQGTPYRNEIRCGGNKIVETAASGDDRQLVAFGAACKNANVVIIDTGADGVANTTAAGDDAQIIAAGTSPANTPCVITGANGIGETTATGDDAQVIPVGTAPPNTTAITCGPNLIADTTANNFNPGGDDVQVVPVGNACANANTVVVDTGANGIADTRAEGPDLVLAVSKPIKLSIRKGSASISKTVSVLVSNVEFGASAPVTRAYKLIVGNGSCPGGTVSMVDADAVSPGLQATANVPLGGRVKASFVVTFKLQDVLSVARNIPFRCAVGIEAQAVDTAPDDDDAASVENNSSDLTVEVYDLNDHI